MEFLYKTTAIWVQMVTEGARDDEIPILNRHLNYKVVGLNPRNWSVD
jgi:hypothetical protein